MYYVIVNEWNYPSERLVKLVRYCEDREVAEMCITEEGMNEWDNFKKECGEIDEEDSGLYWGADGKYLEGYQIVTPEDAEKYYYFRSFIIEVEPLWER